MLELDYKEIFKSVKIMVRVIDRKIEQFLCEARGKKVYCFGAGTIFHRFVMLYPEIHIDGVIDNYTMGEDGMLRIEGRTFSVISLAQFLSLYDKECIIVITCNSYQDIISQLDEKETLSDMACYPSIFLCSDGKTVQSDDLRRWIKNRSRSRNIMVLPKKQDGSVDKFQIWNCVPDYRTAGSKAPNDIRQIALNLGYQELRVHMLKGNSDSSAPKWSVTQNHFDWENCYNRITDESILILQYPTWQNQAAREVTIKKLKKEKKVKVITFFHDIERLRSLYNDEVKEMEFDFFMDVTDVFIVHNERMRAYLETIGVLARKVVCLEIFDYLVDAPIKNRDFDKSVMIAGALDSVKSPYISMLRELNKVKFHLFGKGYLEENISDNIAYHGSYPMDQIVEELVGGFGLVWDGDSIDDCSGSTGRYLRYNNPHKLSLYLAAGYPVIVWDEAATADLVLRYDVGIVVKSLRNLDKILDNLSEKKYIHYKENVRTLSNKLRSGFFTQQALQKAESILS